VSQVSQVKKFDPLIHVGGRAFERVMFRTHTIVKGEDVGDLLVQYVQPSLKPGDIVFMGEKATAISLGRALPVAEVKPGPLARFLVRFVYKTPYGVGLSRAETMEMAVREVGTLRILIAAVIAGICKLFGLKGIFYNIAGRRARSIDGPGDYVLPPYNRYVVLAVLEPDRVCRQASAKVGAPVALVDANDFGFNLIGVSDAWLRRFPWAQVLKDNPAGQSAQSTPFGIVRPLAQEAGAKEAAAGRS
jgi:hypothetical protein